MLVGIRGLGTSGFDSRNLNQYPGIHPLLLTTKCKERLDISEILRISNAGVGRLLATVRRLVTTRDPIVKQTLEILF